MKSITTDRTIDNNKQPDYDTAFDEIKNSRKFGKDKKVRVIPGFHLTLGITVTMLSLIVLIPLASVMVYSLKLPPAEFIRLVTKQNVVNAFVTSIGCSFIAAVINCVFGTIIAWTFVKYDFAGKRVLDGLIELPFALPTAVAGITLSKMYSETGILGKPLASIGIKVSYTHLGLITALVFVGIPFVVRAVMPVLEKMDSQYEEAAYMLGASPSKTFFKVILPEISPALLTGFGLGVSRPAIILNIVVLPLPEGPSNATSFPFSIPKFTLSDARKFPYCLKIFFISTYITFALLSYNHFVCVQIYSLIQEL